jgi:hypothetical protein
LTTTTAQRALGLRFLSLGNSGWNAICMAALRDRFHEPANGLLQSAPEMPSADTHQLASGSQAPQLKLKGYVGVNR